MGSSLLRISCDEEGLGFSSQKYVRTHQKLVKLEEVLYIELFMTFAVIHKL